MATLVKTDFNFPGQKSVYHGKVRDVYNINDDLMVMVATDRISAFDVILSTKLLLLFLMQPPTSFQTGNLQRPTQW